MLHTTVKTHVEDHQEDHDEQFYFEQDRISPAATKGHAAQVRILAAAFVFNVASIPRRTTALKARFAVHTASVCTYLSATGHAPRALQISNFNVHVREQ